MARHWSGRLEQGSLVRGRAQCFFQAVGKDSVPLSALFLNQGFGRLPERRLVTAAGCFYQGDQGISLRHVVSP
ncbi:hypothetical protein XFF7767_410003 [Xanthomonas citri pv. fuscans]|nr:hypothetical protein XFF7767_410003 [Xanthomonas citri pv. fuscans]SOO15943.1 hypothetical protein XFF7766_70031 [Xanthomonas citri pv. fuscans]